MVLRGKVWLLRKINRKIDKDYIMIIVTLFCHVSSFQEARIIVQSLSYSRCLMGLCSSLFDFNSNSIKVERLGELRCIVSSKQGYTTSALETTCFSSDNAKLNMISFTEAESVRYQHIKSDVIFVVQKTSVSRLFRKARVSYFANLIKTKTIDSWFVLDVKIHCFY